MNENKCPVCNAQMIYGQSVGRTPKPLAWCCQCMFQCSPPDLPSISAAMDFSRARAELFKSNRSDTAHGSVVNRYLSAEDCVLEVFK